MARFRHDPLGQEIRDYEALNADTALKLNTLTYRHECLKSMYSDEMNFLDDDQSVDDAIDEFIKDDQSTDDMSTGVK